MHQLHFMNRISIILLIVACLFAACKDSSDTIELDLDYGYEYFPLEIGKYRSYQVDSFIFDSTAQGIVIDTSRSYIRETYIDTLRDNSGRLTYLVERAHKRNLQDAWQVTDIWQEVKTERQAERIEENLRFIKMTFPLQEGNLWNGNLFIDERTIIPVAGESIEIFKNWSYEVDELNTSFAVNDMTFDDVAILFQADNENAIELRYSEEKYARNVGLISREMRILDTQFINPTLPWEEKAQKGFIMEMTMIDHNWD